MTYTFRNFTYYMNASPSLRENGNVSIHTYHSSQVRKTFHTPTHFTAGINNRHAGEYCTLSVMRGGFLCIDV